MSQNNYDLESKPMEYHLQDLYSLLKRVVLLVSISGIAWSLVAPQLLLEWVSMFDLQDNSSYLSIYAPFNWIEVKWSFSIMMGLVTVIPIFSFLIYRFSKPGLYPTEILPIKFILVINCFFLPISILGIWVWAVPKMVEFSESLSKLDNVNAQYDFSEIISLALGFSTMTVIAIILISSLLLSRIIGDASGIYSWFRPRIIVISLGLLIITMPTVFEGLRVPISLAILYICDMSSKLYPLKEYESLPIQNDTALKGRAS
tara:strand:+ start:13083 stop:13859 length:777 start_codon:yes stop_codon:yes gene_type:complete